MNWMVSWSSRMWETKLAPGFSIRFISRHISSSLLGLPLSSTKNIGRGGIIHPPDPDEWFMRRILSWQVWHWVLLTASRCSGFMSARGSLSLSSWSAPGCRSDMMSSPPWQLVHRGWRKTGIISEKAVTDLSWSAKEIGHPAALGGARCTGRAGSEGSNGNGWSDAGGRLAANPTAPSKSTRRAGLTIWARRRAAIMMESVRQNNAPRNPGARGPAKRSRLA